MRGELWRLINEYSPDETEQERLMEIQNRITEAFKVFEHDLSDKSPWEYEIRKEEMHHNARQRIHIVKGYYVTPKSGVALI
jgi:hypothetical protein